VKEKKENVHAIFVSHGLCISEMVAALLGLDYERKSKGLEVPDRQFTGLLNTAWTRARIDLAVGVRQYRSSRLSVMGFTGCR